ncbi:hypothetical protein D3C86_1753750 [compost metagenome]
MLVGEGKGTLFSAPRTGRAGCESWSAAIRAPKRRGSLQAVSNVVANRSGARAMKRVMNAELLEGGDSPTYRVIKARLTNCLDI